MDLETAYWIAFNNVNGLGPAKIYSILKRFNNLETAWKSKIEVFKEISLLSKNNLESIVQTKKEFNPENEFEKIIKKNVKAVKLTDEEYPELLKQTHDPPPVLFMKGNYRKDIFNKCIGVVGTRKPSNYGKKIAYNLSKSLVNNNITVVSGLALGIDAYSHRGALENDKGLTIAVLGCGVNTVYPKTNQKIYEKIASEGLLISEYLPDTKPESWQFPARNRIISGLSKGIIIVEGGKKSGAVITADFANEQGRDIFAIPGEITNKMSYAPNELIKQGANIITSSDDISLYYNWATKNEADNLSNSKEIIFTEKIKNLTDQEKKVYLVLNDQPKHIDNIINELSFPHSEIMSLLVMLEIKGLINQLPGKKYRVT